MGERSPSYGMIRSSTASRCIVREVLAARRYPRRVPIHVFFFFLENGENAEHPGNFSYTPVTRTGASALLTVSTPCRRVSDPDSWRRYSPRADPLLRAVNVEMKVPGIQLSRRNFERETPALEV